ncbi:MAG: hypothetical protein QG626_897 [Patescibacteria group bacterium]|nr:hypothetical protein [Patescibacteria group bacterium]
MLERRGYSVIEATSLGEAKSLIETNLDSIEVILSDINLGDGNSTGLHAAVLPLLSLHFIGWVSMTGGASQEERQYFTDHGVTVIEKSTLNFDTLQAAITSASKRT